MRCYTNPRFVYLLTLMSWYLWLPAQTDTYAVSDTNDAGSLSLSEFTSSWHSVNDNHSHHAGWYRRYPSPSHAGRGHPAMVDHVSAIRMILMIAKDIFVWIVGPRRSVNYFDSLV